MPITPTGIVTVDGVEYQYEIHPRPDFPVELASPMTPLADRYHLNVTITRLSDKKTQELKLHSIQGHYDDTNSFIKDKLVDALSRFKYGSIQPDFDGHFGKECNWC